MGAKATVFSPLTQKKRVPESNSCPTAPKRSFGPFDSRHETLPRRIIDLEEGGLHILNQKKQQANLALQKCTFGGITKKKSRKGIKERNKLEGLLLLGLLTSI